MDIESEAGDIDAEEFVALTLGCNHPGALQAIAMLQGKPGPGLEQPKHPHPGIY